MATSNLSTPLTSFVGRNAELQAVSDLVRDARLITLVGAGGSGKSRLAVETGLALHDERPDGVWHLDLAPLLEPTLLLPSLAKVLGARDDDVASAQEAIEDHVRDRELLVVLDNCEHLIDGCIEAVKALLSAPKVVVLATSREPLGIPGEVVYRVPSLDLGAATALFRDRAHRARADVASSSDLTSAIEEICTRLDGMPLAIELAAARIRVLSVSQIAEGLQDRFRLLTGGSRGGLRRQQTLRASVEWSYSLLPEPERTLFRRLAVFAGRFDVRAVEAVAAGDGVEADEVLDQLSSIVDKSLVLADEIDGIVRYRLLETLRQYALERLGDSGETESVRRRHRDHYLGVAIRAFEERFGSSVETDLDNFRVALQWSIACGDSEIALLCASMLFGLWYPGHIAEGRRWLDAALDAAPDAAPAIRAGALAASAWLESFAMGEQAVPRAETALELSTQLGDDRLVSFALLVLGLARGHDPARENSDVDDELAIVRQSRDRARASGNDLILALAVLFEGALLAETDPIESRRLLEEAVDRNRALGNSVGETMCLDLLAQLAVYRGDLDEPLRHAEDARRRPERSSTAYADAVAAWSLALRGDGRAARKLAEAAARSASDGRIGFVESQAYSALGLACLAEGSPHEAFEAFRLAEDVRSTGVALAPAFFMLTGTWAEAEMAVGDLPGARARIDGELQRPGAPRVRYRYGGLLSAAARLALLEDDLDRAVKLAHDSLAVRLEIGDKIGVVDTLELLVAIAAREGASGFGARLAGATVAARERIGYAPLQTFGPWRDEAVATLRSLAGDGDEFERQHDAGATHSLDDAVAYARRGRGERRRPDSGWASLTPTEREVVLLLSEGLDNPSIAERLFISRRTVNSHLTRIYRKVGITSRVQLAAEASRRFGR